MWVKPFIIPPTRQFQNCKYLHIRCVTGMGLTDKKLRSCEIYSSMTYCTSQELKQNSDQTPVLITILSYLPAKYIGINQVLQDCKIVITHSALGSSVNHTFHWIMWALYTIATLFDWKIQYEFVDEWVLYLNILLSCQLLQRVMCLTTIL